MGNFPNLDAVLLGAIVDSGFVSETANIQAYKAEMDSLLNQAAAASPSFKNVMSDMNNDSGLTASFGQPQIQGAAFDFDYGANHVDIGVPKLQQNNYKPVSDILDMAHEFVHGGQRGIANDAGIGTQTITDQNVITYVQEEIRQEQDAYTLEDVIRQDLVAKGWHLSDPEPISPGLAAGLTVPANGYDPKTLRGDTQFEAAAQKASPKMFVNIYGPQYFRQLLVKYGPFEAGELLAGMMGIKNPNVIIPLDSSTNFQFIVPGRGFVSPKGGVLTLSEWVVAQMDAIADEPDVQANLLRNGNGLWWKSAKTDPLVVDISGGGLNIVDQSSSSTHFAFASGGPSTLTSWIGSGTGFLVMPNVQTGTVDGSNLVTSFDQLRSMDNNGDGIIDFRDEAYSQLRIWQDVNTDGIADPLELSTLADLGIISLSLSVQTLTQTNGLSIVTGTALATMADGSTREIASVELSHSNTDTSIGIQPAWEVSWASMVQALFPTSRSLLRKTVN